MTLKRLRCLLGHRGGPGTKVGDVVFAECSRCGGPVIRALRGRWYTRPKQPGSFTPDEVGPVGAERLIRQARAEAPLLHRIRRRRVRAMDAYFW